MGLDVEGEAARREVNRAVNAWASSAAKFDERSSVAGVVCCIDTTELLPYSKDNGLWEVDGLHFSRAGSQHFGARLAEQLSAYLLRRRARREREDRSSWPTPLLIGTSVAAL